MIPFSLVRWPSLCSVQQAAKEQCIGISGAFWTCLCRLLSANGTTWLIDSCSLLHISLSEDSQPGSCLKDWNLHFPLEKHFLDSYVFARQTKGKGINTMGQDWLFWKTLCWVHHSTKSERKILYFCQNKKKLIFNKEFKNAFLFSKLQLQPFQSGNFS